MAACPLAAGKWFAMNTPEGVKTEAKVAPSPERAATSEMLMTEVIEAWWGDTVDKGISVGLMKGSEKGQTDGLV